MLPSMFAALFAASPDAILIADEAGHYVEANPAALALLGYTREDLLRLSVGDIVAPGPIWAAEEYARFLQEGMWQGDVELCTKEGRVVPAEVRAVVVPGPEGSFYASFLRDTTDRRRGEAALQAAETKYRTLVEHLPAFVYLLAADAVQTPLYFSPYYDTLIGHHREDGLRRTMHWLELVHPEDRQRIAAEVDRTAPLDQVFQAEYRHRRGDGSYVWVRDECVPLRDDAGQIFAWQGVMLDISDRKAAEEELRSAMEVAQTANRAKGVFLDLMSHELRTPLQAVLGYAEFLLIAPQDSLTDAQREDIGTIHQAGGRMLALIDQLLDLSRMEAGGIDFAVKPFDLARVIETVRQDIAPQAGAKGLAVEIAFPPSLPSVVGDAERVRQILLNLAGNAVKFTTEGSVRITVTPMSIGGVEVAVSDTGIGISADALPHVFEAFHQVDSSLTRQQGGSGLGLAIAWKLAQQMGGSLSGSSEPGVGSSFMLHLPERAYHAQAARASTTTSSEIDRLVHPRARVQHGTVNAPQRWPGAGCVSSW
jgi:hypothetical protein